MNKKPNPNNIIPKLIFVGVLILEPNLEVKNHAKIGANATIKIGLND